MTQREEFYQMVRQLRDDLKAVGQDAWSIRVDDTLYGATSGEILGDVGVVLHHLRNDEIAHHLHLEERLDRMLHILEGWLGPYRP
jgi:hypothetical protein